jgi:hypothetical protein
MLKTLAKAADRDNQLKNVFYAVFDDDPHFITGIQLQFPAFSITFRAEANDDTLSIKIGRLEVNPQGSLVDVSDSEPWS